jgi:hypothetical protein
VVVHDFSISRFVGLVEIYRHGPIYANRMLEANESGALRRRVENAKHSSVSLRDEYATRDSGHQPFTGVILAGESRAGSADGDASNHG